MSQYASISIPKPKNWQDFERHTRVLFQCILNDPNTMAHGRSGQAQQGVDVYGRRDRLNNHWVGVQCKEKSGSEKLTRAELEREVNEAKKFLPRLSELIVVTTAPDDAHIQRVARQKTQQHAEEGLFSVDVWGWGTLESEIIKYPQAAEAFHPDLTPYSRKQELVSEEILAATRQSNEMLAELLHQQTIASHGSVGESAADTSSAAMEVVENALHSEIDGYRDILREGKAKTAKSLLENLKDRTWPSASERVRFRITTNIGAALLQLGQEQLAADYFIEAISYDGSDRIALANVALAYLIKGEPDNAVAAAERALALDGENAAAAAHLISGYISDLRVSDPFSVVPEVLHGTPEVLASAVNFLSQRGDSEWRKLARRAAQKHVNDRLLQRRAAEAILDEAVTSDHFAIGAVTCAAITPEDVRHAAAVLHRAWDEVLNSEVGRSDSALPHNLALALWISDESDRAAAVLDQALERYPHDEMIREQRAALFFEAGEPDAATALLGGEAERPGLAIMQAQTVASSEPQRARSIILGADFSAATERQRLVAGQLVIDTFVQEGLLEEAQAEAESLLESHPGSVAPLVEMARIQQKRGDEDASATLTRAMATLGDQSPFPERFMVANALEEAGRYDDVGVVLDGHVDVGYDSPALRLLLYSYVNADRRAAAYELLGSLPDQVASRAPYLKALTAVNARRKDFPAALRALDRYLELRPNDLEMRLRWFQYCARLNQEDRIGVYLSGDVEGLAGTPELRIDLAHWLNLFGFETRALKLAYSVFLYHSASPEVHLRYIGLILPPGRTTSIPLDLETIGNDVAFAIDDGEGGRPWFIIEPDADLRKDETYLSPENPIAQKVRGLKVGDAIEWSPNRSQWTVMAIKHKYLHALHRSMENFERHFPTAQGLRHVKVDPNAKQPFREVLEDVKGRHDQVQAVFDLLAEKQAPIHVAASMLGADVIDVRYGLRDAGRMHRVCTGTHQERGKAIEAIQVNEARGCVIDALTLDLIRRLKIENVVREACGPIGVTGSTRDLYWRRLHEMKEVGEPSTTLYWKDGQYVRYEPTQEEWNTALELREADLNWIDKYTTIIPAEGAADPPVNLRQLNDLIGLDFLDDMLAAQGSERILLCQDQSYRILAEQSLGVTGTWLQPLLMLARDQGILSSKEYNDAVIRLVDIGDHFISVDGGLLLEAARGQEDSLASFRLVTERLGGAEADIVSHIRVAVGFLGIVWTEEPHETETAKQTSLLLDNLLRGRRDWRNVVATVRWLFNWRFGPCPELDHYMARWLRGHFLLRFEK